MKAFELQKYLVEQQRSHAKSVFTVTELANAARNSIAAMRVDLNRLKGLGVIEQYARGRYGLPGAARVEELVGTLDTGAYVSGMYVLYRHGLVTQRPTRVTCITNKRHNRSRIRPTSAGVLEFVCVGKRIYAPPEKGRVASPEQALCDYVYLSRRSGLEVRSQVTFRKLDTLDAVELGRALEHYPASVQNNIASLSAPVPSAVVP